MNPPLPGLTADQTDIIAQLLHLFSGRPRAELMIAVYDPDQGRDIACAGSTEEPGLLFAVGLTFLRRAHAGVIANPGAVYAAPMTEALQTALPFLETAGVAQPAARRTARAGRRPTWRWRRWACPCRSTWWTRPGWPGWTISCASACGGRGNPTSWPTCAMTG